MTITMTKTEAEQTAAKMDEMELVIRGLVKIANLYVERLSLEIQNSMERGDVEGAEIAAMSIQIIQKTIDKAEGKS